MKKTLSIVLALVLALSLCIPAFAASSVSVTSSNTSAVSFRGSIDGAKAAVIVQIVNGSGDILAMQSFETPDGAFSGTISGLSLDYGTYTLRAADYDGGAWTTTDFTLSAPAQTVPTPVPTQEPEKETESQTEINPDGSVTETKKETATDADGNTVETVTETTTDADGNTAEVRTETKTDADGNVVGETVTESASTTAADGTKTEIASEQSTERTTDADGNVVETLQRTETVTTTDAEGNATRVAVTTTGTSTTSAVTEEDETGRTVVKETVEGTKTDVTVTTAADGSESTSTTVTTTEGTRTAALDADGNGTVTETMKDTAVTTAADGSEITVVTETNISTTIETDEAETVTRTEEKVVTVTDEAGNAAETTTVTTEKETADGSTGTTVVDGEGRLLAAETSLSAAALEAAAAEGVPVVAPMTVPPVSADDAQGAVAVALRLPAAERDADGDGVVAVSEMTRVEIPVSETADSNGVIAMYREADGSLTPVKECRIGSVIVPVAGSCELVIVDNTKRFSDVPAEYWGADYVTFVTAREIFNGYNGSFDPETEMDRAMVAQVLYNLDRGSEAGDASAVFEDVDAEAWYNAAIGWANAGGIVYGSGTNFAPTESVTRQDFVTMLYRYAGYAGYDVSARKALDAFSDADEISDYAREAMEWACAVGILSGYPDGTLCPGAASTRTVVAVMMKNFVSNVD